MDGQIDLLFLIAGYLLSWDHRPRHIPGLDTIARDMLSLGVRMRWGRPPRGQAGDHLLAGRRDRARARAVRGGRPGDSRLLHARALALPHRWVLPACPSPPGAAVRRTSRPSLARSSPDEGKPQIYTIQSSRTR